MPPDLPGLSGSGIASELVPLTDVVELVREVDERVRSVLVVGHERSGSLGQAPRVQERGQTPFLRRRRGTTSTPFRAQRVRAALSVKRRFAISPAVDATVAVTRTELAFFIAAMSVFGSR